MAKLRCEKSGTEYEITAGTELKDAYRIDPTLPLRFGCRKGGCGVCLIRILQHPDHLSPITKQEKATLETLKASLDGTSRLACQCALLGDVAIDV